MTTEVRAIRASDREREGAVNALADHHADGRLGLDEFTERINRAYAATYVGDLVALFGDLPTMAMSGAGPVRRNGPPRRAYFVGPVVLAAVVVAAFTVHFPVWLVFVLGWFMFVKRGRSWSAAMANRRSGTELAHWVQPIERPRKQLARSARR